MMLTEIPQLFPTPLLGGESGATISPPDDDRLVTGSLTMFPTPLLRGFARSGGPADPLFAGSMTMNPTPLMRGFASLEQRVSPLPLSLYPTPLQRGFASLEQRVSPLPLSLYPTPQKDGFTTAAAGRTVYYAEQDAAGTAVTSTTVFGDQLALTLTGAQVENKTWLVLGSCSANVNSSSQATDARLRHDTAGVTFGDFEGEPGDSSYNTPMSFGGVVTFGASPGSQTFSIEAKAVLGFNNTTINNRIMLIELTSDDAYAYDGSALTTSTNTSTWSTLADIDVPVDGDYDIIAFSTMQEPAASSNSWDYELLDKNGSRDKYLLGQANVSTTRKNPYMFHSAKTGLLAGDGATLRAKISNGSSAKSLYYRGIVALNRSRWAQVGYANDPTSRGPAGTTYAERNPASTLTATLLDRETIVFGNATQYLQTGDRPPSLQLLIDSTKVGEGVKMGGNIAGADRPYIFFKKLSPGAGSHTMSWQFKQPTGSSGTTDYKFADVGYWQI